MPTGPRTWSTREWGDESRYSKVCIRNASGKNRLQQVAIDRRSDTAYRGPAVSEYLATHNRFAIQHLDCHTLF